MWVVPDGARPKEIHNNGEFVDIIQLRSLYTSFLPRLYDYPHIHLESQRYIQLYQHSRPPLHAWYLNSSLLPQEILERPPEVSEENDVLGTRVCAGCRRALHQDSFRDSFAEQWRLRLGEHGRVCHTCRQARRLKDSPPNFKRRLTR